MEGRQPPSRRTPTGTDQSKGGQSNRGVRRDLAEDDVARRHHARGRVLQEPASVGTLIGPVPRALLRPAARHAQCGLARFTLHAFALRGLVSL